MVSRIGIIGAGKLGSPMAAALASKGFEVLICDVDKAKVDALNNGQAPVQETGLQELLTENKSRLRATDSISETVRFADVTFVVTATPSNPDGRFSLEYTLPVCEEIGRTLGKPLGKPAFHPVVITSTVMPGDTWGPIRDTLEKYSGRKCGESFGLCYNPEFIALGSVIRDFLNPDFVLIGASDPLTEARISSVYRTFTDAPIASIGIANAEVAKLGLNCALAFKISYANLLAQVCEKIPNSDVDSVMRAIGLDSRIGSKLLKGAVSFSGPCLPRDVRALATLGVSLPLVIDAFNKSIPIKVAEFIKETIDAPPVHVLGLSYKVGSPLQDESFGSSLLAEIDKREMGLAHHPADWENIPAVVLALPDPKYAELDFSGKTVFDCWRAFPHLKSHPTIKYIPLGVGPEVLPAA